MTYANEVDLRNALGLLHERLEKAMLDSIFDVFIETMYRSGDYTHHEVRDSVGYVLGDKGYDRFDERYGYSDPNGDDD